jgi:RNA polymerase sigma factor (sigma-70 family)
MADFETFFTLNYQPVVRSLALAFGDRADIEDAVQDAFAQAYLKWAAVSVMERPATWVYVVAARRFRRSLRRGHRLLRPSRRPPAAGDGEEAIVGRIDIEALLAGLPPRQRATVVLRYLADLSVDEVARALHCAPGTVKAATSAALRHLKVDLEEPQDA